MQKKIAVVIYNLGGPDSLNSVQQFLFNLFNDPHIITMPQPFRYCLAKLISILRCKKSKGIYEQMGGKSTILQETELQAEALNKFLNTNYSMKDELKYDVIPMMRYWHPMTEEVIMKVQKGNYDNIILLPLYPHFSTTTTLSSLREWFKHAKDMPPTNIVCCYYNHPGFINANATLINEMLASIETTKPVRLLFSAHSIPQYISDKGDPYKKQIEESIKDIVAKSNIDNNQYTICYQSKVGRLKWLEPDIKSELLAAGARNEAVVVIPISFTSEHSETLVELDIEYAEMAKEHGIEFYRVPTLSSHNLFIETLAKLTVTALQKFVPDIITETETRLNLYCGAEMCCQRVNINAY